MNHVSDEQAQELTDRLRQQVLDAYDLPPELVQAWETNHAAEQPASSEEKTA